MSRVPSFEVLLPPIRIVFRCYLKFSDFLKRRFIHIHCIRVLSLHRVLLVAAALQA
jgi:hypothetical protein